MHNLSELRKGDKAKIVGFTRENIPARFYDLGLLPGVLLEVRVKAPFGGPIAVSIPSIAYLVALRRQEAKLIMIEKQNEFA